MTSTIEAALERALKNAETRRGEVILHASDWLAIMDALAALRAPVATEFDALLERLEAVFHDGHDTPKNPDGPEAAAAIRELLARNVGVGGVNNPCEQAVNLAEKAG